MGGSPCNVGGRLDEAERKQLRGSNEAMYRVLVTGRFAIQAETDHLKAREEARAAGQTHAQIRRSGVNQNGGDVKSELFSRHP